MVKELQLQSFIRDVPNFPKQGIVFKDITPLLAHPEARRSVVEEIANNYQDQKIDAIAAVEARGFIFGSLLAEALSVPFIPIRKSGKLPFKKIHEEYALEYGTASIEMHEDAIQIGSRVLIHDDLLATGGTSSAAANMIKKLGGEVVGFSFVINLTFLEGERILIDRFGVKPHYLVSY